MSQPGARGRLTVKITTQHPEWPLLRQTPGSSGTWGRCDFFVNEPVERCDLWVVCDGLERPETTSCPPGATLLVTWEPPTGVRPPYRSAFTAQFGEVLTCHRGIRGPAVRYGQQGHPWFVGRSYDELVAAEEPEKSIPLVIITSDKAFSPGHRARLEFARALKERFGSDARLVGRGIDDFEDKWDVLAPARYALAVENAVYDDWITEKLPDCYLASAFPIYHGAPNVGRYFEEASFARVDVDDLDGATRLIERLLHDGSHWERSQEHLRAARLHYLDQLQLFPLLADLAELGQARHTEAPVAVTLYPESPPSFVQRVAHRRRQR